MTTVVPFGCVPSIRMPGAAKDVVEKKSGFWACVRAVSDVRFRAGTLRTRAPVQQGQPPCTGTLEVCIVSISRRGVAWNTFRTHQYKD